MEVDGFRDGSGLFGVVGGDAVALAHHALGALVHRGGAGVSLAAADGQAIRVARSRAGITQLDAPALDRLRGRLVIGQARGGLGPPDSAGLPLDGGDRMAMGYTGLGPVAVAVAGRFTNGGRLRRDLKQGGALLQSDSDAEVLLHLLAQSGQRTVVNRLVDALWKLEGAFSVLLLAPELLIALRDPRGFRPMLAGEVEGSLAFASEDTALLAVGGRVERALDPGEMVVVEGGRLVSVRPLPAQPEAGCVQELVSLARPDGTVRGRNVYGHREALGAALAAASPPTVVERVVATPGDEAYGLGFARTSGVAYAAGLLWTGVSERRLVANPAVVGGRRVALVTRSLLTGEVLRAAVGAIRAAGALQVHVRVASPAVIAPCVYGVPSPTSEELVASRRTDPVELADWLGAASYAAPSLDELEGSLGPGWCMACVSGARPVEPEADDDQLPLF